MRGIATYLVACVAQVVQQNLSIVNDLLGNDAAARDQLRTDIVGIIGEDNTSITQDFREDNRDPWLTEGLAHLLLKVSRRAAHQGLHPPGRILVLTLVHDDPKDHGLDVCGIYQDAVGLGLTVGEAKASEAYGSRHATAAAKLFKEVADGARDVQIRRAVAMLRNSLRRAHRATLAPEFWKQTRSFVAVVGHSHGSMKTNVCRRTYGELIQGTQKVHLVALELRNYRVFFDAIADEMRRLAEPPASGGP